ncbi:hypothetical protein PIB30_079627, partial [Stylosanthes scabra]|nr:hypothetical protein [Stylosanthes scabra]
HQHHHNNNHNSNRSRFLSGKYIFYNYTTLGSSAYGEHWHNLCRIAALDVLFTHGRDETTRLIHNLADFAEVELTSRFYGTTVTWRIWRRRSSSTRWFGVATAFWREQ